MSDTEQEARSRAKGRSPNYPGIALEAALQRAQQLYERERNNWANYDVVIQHWNYQPKSGSGRIVWAALKKFGLLAEEGTGAHKRGRLTDLALAIIQDTRPNSPDRQKSVQEAALAPSVHRDLWEEFGGTLPSDENLHYSLVRNRGFTENGAREFIQEFRATIAFSRLGETGRMPEHEEGKDPKDQPLTPPGGTLTHTPPADPEAFRVPLGAGRAAFLRLPSPFTEKDWDQMIRVLDAMKPGLVEEEPPPLAPSPPSGEENGQAEAE
jgi:hypothetical protein